MSVDLNMCWSDQPLVCFDVETTSVDPQTCGVVSVATVLFEGKFPTKHFYSLCNPGCDISPESTQIHGIDSEQIKDAPRLDELAAEILNVARDAIPCGYNGQAYDRIVLRRHISGTDCPLFDPAWSFLDPLTIVRDADRFVGGKKRHTLEVTCKRWGVGIDGAHNALADCFATGGLLYRMLDRKAMKPCKLGVLLEHMRKRQEVHEAEFKAYLESKQARASNG